MIEHLQDRGVYFISDSSSFSYAATCLADGLSLLGIPIFANLDYAEPLITDFCFVRSSDPHERSRSACVVVDLQDTRQYLHQIVRFEPPHPSTFLLCMQDDASAFCANGITAILAAHENRLWKPQGVRIPIGFGLSSAMIRKNSALSATQPRVERILYNFRPSLNQHLRAALDLTLLPRLERQFTVHRDQTNPGRWNDEYYNLLGSSLGCLAYGGTFGQNLSSNAYLMKNERFRTFMGCIDIQRDPVVLRWDSWRFWESLVCGCLTIHLDFEQYGFELPVMPINWQHYVGLDLASLEQDLERMMDERIRLQEIGWNGRQWVIENYSPQAVAKRFVETFYLSQVKQT